MTSGATEQNSSSTWPQKVPRHNDNTKKLVKFFITSTKVILFRSRLTNAASAREPEARQELVKGDSEADALHAFGHHLGVHHAHQFALVVEQGASAVAKGNGHVGFDTGRCRVWPRMPRVTVAS